MTQNQTPALGAGLYTFPEAMGIIRHGRSHASVRQLRYWLNSELAPSFREEVEYPLLSFSGLISLEIVGRLHEAGASIQAIRKFIGEMKRRAPGLAAPLTAGSFFTDGHRIWHQTNPNDISVLEIVGYPDQTAWVDIIRCLSDEIRIDPFTQRAEAWNLAPAVEIDPRVQFGTPVVKGTRIPVRSIAMNLSVGTVEEVADWYELSTEQVEGVRNYLVAA
jgi:uncharacterized protein (DUF433 family)/DNA-binding transcriptional MerR regulator